MPWSPAQAHHPLASSSCWPPAAGLRFVERARRDGLHRDGEHRRSACLGRAAALEARAQGALVAQRRLRGRREPRRHAGPGRRVLVEAFTDTNVYTAGQEAARSRLAGIGAVSSSGREEDQAAVRRLARLPPATVVVVAAASLGYQVLDVGSPTVHGREIGDQAQTQGRAYGSPPSRVEDHDGEAAGRRAAALLREGLARERDALRHRLRHAAFCRAAAARPSTSMSACRRVERESDPLHPRRDLRGQPARQRRRR